MTRADPPAPKRGPIGQFIDRNYRHFNAATLKDATDAYIDLLDRGGKMFLTLAGAMSTAELGLTLAEMIRKDKVHAICCTGANLEEDVFNLVAHTHYERLPDYRLMKPEEDQALADKGLNRVTDTAIPEGKAMGPIEQAVQDRWKAAEKDGKRFLPHQYLYQILRSGELKEHYEIDPKDSWMLAAANKNLPIFVPGWEDSTLGNVFAANCLLGEIKDPGIVGSGIEYMMTLAAWYRKASDGKGIGFFQIGGGIAGDFPICVVPLLKQDMDVEKTALWAYFCQISDSTTSYGSYSGATPNEKISWGKLDPKTPAFVIESDASIVAPLMFSTILGL